VLVIPAFSPLAPSPLFNFWGLKCSVFSVIFKGMETTYRLNTRELGSSFIDSLRDIYPDQNIEIMVREQDETEYLNSSPANRSHLEKAIKNVEQGKNIVSFETLEQAIQCAEERAAVS